MANQFASVSNALAILKNYYAGPIVSQFNDDLPLYRGAEKGKEKWNGQQVVRPVKVRRNQGIGATSDGGTLPKIGQQTTVQALIPATYNYLRFGLTGPLIKSSQGDKGAFINAMEFEMTEGLNDLKVDVNRQLSWTGTGYLATVAANVVASNVVTINNRDTQAGIASAEGPEKFLDIGMSLDIIDSNSNLIASSASITAMSGLGTATVTLTLDSIVTCAANNLLIRSGSNQQEITGMLAFENGATTSLFNISRSTYPSFGGNNFDNGGLAMNLNFLQQAQSAARRRGGGKISALYSDFDSERYYNRLLVVDKRYIGEKVTGDGTFTDKDKVYLNYGGAPWLADQGSPTRVFFLTEGNLKKYVLAELEWADETGSYLIAQTSADAFEARLRLFMNLFLEKPSASACCQNYISP
jgi:hypothetical protein